MRWFPKGGLLQRFTGISGWFPSFSYERDSSEAGYRRRCSVIDWVGVERTWRTRPSGGGYFLNLQGARIDGSVREHCSV